MKTLLVLLTTTGLWSFASVLAAQAPVDDLASTPPESELRVVTVNNMPVEVLERALSRVLSPGGGRSDIRLIGETSTNKLILNAPKNKLSAWLDLLHELDRPQPTVTISVIEAAVSPDSEDKIRTAKTLEVQQAIENATKQGWLKVIDRMHFSVADKNEATIQVGRQAPMVTGRQFRGGAAAGRGGTPGKSYTFSDLGTVFKATPRVGENAVLLEFSFEKSELVPPGDDSDDPASIVTTRTQSNVRIPKDESVVIGGMRMGPDDKPIGWKLIISAAVE